MGEGRGGVELGMGRPLTHPYRLGERPSLVRSTPSPPPPESQPSLFLHPPPQHNTQSSQFVAAWVLERTTASSEQCVLQN